MDRIFLGLGAILGFLAVGMGAFGAHALRDRLSQDMMNTFEVGVRYQMYHALVLMLLSVFVTRISSPSIVVSGWLMAGGSVVFSGTIYTLSLTGIRWWGAITPLGGLALLGGWLCLIWAAWDTR